MNRRRRHLVKRRRYVAKLISTYLSMSPFDLAQRELRRKLRRTGDPKALEFAGLK